MTQKKKTKKKTKPKYSLEKAKKRIVSKKKYQELIYKFY